MHYEPEMMAGAEAHRVCEGCTGLRRTIPKQQNALSVALPRLRERFAAFARGLNRSRAVQQFAVLVLPSMSRSLNAGPESGAPCWLTSHVFGSGS
jgi:hypothetical protein